MILQDKERAQNAEKDLLIKCEQKVRDLTFKLYGQSTLKSQLSHSGAQNDDTNFVIDQIMPQVNFFYINKFFKTYNREMLFS